MNTRGEKPLTTAWSSIGHLGVETFSFCCAIFSLSVHTILTGIKARDGSSQHLNKVPHTSEVLVHVPEVSVDVVPIPEKAEY